ncbi:MAG: tRNA (adenosine(37)-N6)-dimethylallyltransferase MiaA [Oscillospiraceae bacterium]|nr:tRNA (adenosine(37)-N6)-dimethylallyltransferase MiaA [Oscillospiraceae bacterium]
MTERPVIVITGPTATGKTALGVELALALDGEVVSADSMQVYRGMDIGTGKVTAEEARGVRHHMIDIAEPEESFSAAAWVQLAAECVEDIFARGKTPLIVGGTGLYIDSLLSGRDFARRGDERVRAELNAEYDRAGGEEMLRRLAEVDPRRAEVLHSGDKRRIVRALEIFRLTGETMTAHDERTRLAPPRWPCRKYALMFSERQTLYDRIDRRVDKMAEDGLFDEVRGLLARGLGAQHTSMQAIGYKEAALAAAGEMSEVEALELIKLRSRRYAKRQLTWLRRDDSVRWLCREGTETDTQAAVKKIMSDI